ncbi:MAG: hypothetical protein E7163_05845 [Firmicutes bacterium]|nr:hypothetical protein [Bacillota bacterium]
MKKRDYKKIILPVIGILVLGIGISFGYFITELFIKGEGSKVDVQTAYIGGATVTTEGSINFDVSNRLPGFKNVSMIKVTATSEIEDIDISYNLVFEGKNTLYTPITYYVYKTDSEISNVNTVCEDVVIEGSMNYYSEECTISNLDKLGHELEFGTIKNSQFTTVNLLEEESITATTSGSTVYYYVIFEVPNLDEEQNLDMGGYFDGNIKVAPLDDGTSKINTIEILATLDGNKHSSFPSKSEATPTSVSCTNGATGSFDYANWVVEVDSIENTTCTVNFTSNINQSFATYLTTNNVCSTTPTTNDAAKDCLVNENNYGYRYEGAIPNNYVLFNNELWRIIGVFNVKNSVGTEQNLVKIIKGDTLDALVFATNNKNDWVNSSLQKQLNSEYLNKSNDATCNLFSTSITKICKFSQIGINDVSRLMIENVAWNIGAASSTSLSESEMYDAERGSTPGLGATSATWTGHVGLMYASDYLYSKIGTSAAGSWLYQDGNQWTLTPTSTHAYAQVYINFAGGISSSSVTNGQGIRPTVYLKSSVQILGGNGTYDFPYIIK